MNDKIWISILKIKNENLYLSGRYFDLETGCSLYADDGNGNKFPILLKRSPALDIQANNDKPHQLGYFFEIFLPLRDKSEYRFLISKGAEISTLNPIYGYYSKLLDFDDCGFVYKKFIIKKDAQKINIAASNPLQRIKFERAMEVRISEESSVETAVLRKEVLRLKKREKPIWLLSDRSDSAGDNGQAMFEFLLKDADAAFARERYDIRFVISSDSPDSERMREIGPVVEAGSEMHKLLFLASELIISSAADDWIRNPLGSNLKYFRDLVDNHYVFLQHGVVKDDLSAWLHKCKKNISIFITSASDERNSICEGDYGYDEDIVKLTGLARYDKLQNNPRKHVAILPTWRLYAANSLKAGSSERPYSDVFKNSEYCMFYNRLINDPFLIDCLNEHGYSATFYLHPSHMNQRSDFEGNDTINVWDGIVPFSDVFNESSLLVTDYSSVAIDFAYLGKPVIYTQFDKEKFFSTHSYVEGYYDYERDGFGPVCYDYESGVNEIIKAIENDCAEPDIYRSRVDNFFAFHDKHNCRRIYNEILGLLSSQG